MIIQSKRLATAMLVFALLGVLLFPTSCGREGNPLVGLWELESGDMDLTYGEGRTLLEFKSNGDIEISAEMPISSDDEMDSGYELIRFRTIKIKYEIITESRLKLSTTQLGETIKEEANFSLNGNKLTINAGKSGTLILNRR